MNKINCWCCNYLINNKLLIHNDIYLAIHEVLGTFTSHPWSIGNIYLVIQKILGTFTSSSRKYWEHLPCHPGSIGNIYLAIHEVLGTFTSSSRKYWEHLPRHPGSIGNIRNGPSDEGQERQRQRGVWDHVILQSDKINRPSLLAPSSMWLCMLLNSVRVFVSKSLNFVEWAGLA